MWPAFWIAAIVPLAPSTKMARSWCLNFKPACSQVSKKVMSQWAKHVDDSLGTQPKPTITASEAANLSLQCLFGMAATKIPPVAARNLVRSIEKYGNMLLVPQARPCFTFYGAETTRRTRNRACETTFFSKKRLLFTTAKPYMQLLLLLPTCSGEELQWRWAQITVHFQYLASCFTLLISLLLFVRFFSFLDVWPRTFAYPLPGHPSLSTSIDLEQRQKDQTSAQLYHYNRFISV